jgi:streptogramin lyase
MQESAMLIHRKFVALGFLLTILFVITLPFTSAETYACTGQWSSQLTQGIRDIAVDNQGYVYVADGSYVKKFSDTGAYQTQWSITGSAWGIAVDGNGNIFVSDMQNHCIKKFSSDGTLINQWGSYGSGNLQFGDNGPRGLDIDSSGNIYVADNGNHRIVKVDSTGGFVTQWLVNSGSNVGYPEGVAVDNNGHVFVTAGMTSNQMWAGAEFVKFSDSGSLMSSVGCGANYNMEGVTCDSQGNVYVVYVVAGGWGGYVEKFTNDLVSTSSFADSTFYNGQAYMMWDVSVDNAGYAYVTEPHNNRILIFHEGVQLPLPESPFGAITMVMACFCAFAVVYRFRKK